MLVGSRARTDVPADEWSDVDLVLVVEEPARYLDDTGWLRELGTPIATFVEPTLMGQRERRVLWEDGLDVDLPILPIPVAKAFLEEQVGPAGTVVRRGARVLLDRDGWLTEAVDQARSTHPPQPALDQPALDRLVNDFWYHALWTARKARRGELWVAVECCDGVLKQLLLEMLRWSARLRAGVDTWHGGRFLESWLDPETRARLPATFAGYDAERLAPALLATAELFRQTTREVSEAAGLRYPEEVDRRVSALVAETLAS
jgi:aminoglycoside 6-adenylyltransferase